MLILLFLLSSQFDGNNLFSSFARVNEADIIEKIATDVSNKLNATPSKDFDGMVGFHLKPIGN